MLSKKIIEILEQHDITLHKREKQDGQFYREIEFYSDAGEDVIETIWYDGTNESFCRAFDKNADDFDPDDHAEMYVNMRGQRGVPGSNNVWSMLKSIPNIVSANICDTKKAAGQLVEHWNNCYKKNGTFLFDETF